jgi:ADP-dependent NAD(P)H-hydrate dehydratase / NAD(P)H-hydrate epimerase
MKLVTSDQMRAIEAQAFAAGTTQAELMETAGRHVAEAVARRLGGARAKRILVLVGPGNNGGDGLVAARYLYEEEADVRVLLLAPRPANDPNLIAVLERDIDLTELDEAGAMHLVANNLQRCDAVIDAVLGTGRQRPLDGVTARVFDALRDRRCPLFAVDLPTGVNADTGAVDPHAQQADVTLTLGYSKLGLHLLPGSGYAGEVEVLDIGLDPASGAGIYVEIMTTDWARSALPDRPLVSNKGTFGRVMVVAGSESYTGAATLCCLGALRAGAGLVTLACIPSVRAAVAARLPEVTFLVLPEQDGALAGEAAIAIARGLEGYDVLLIGPGLGQSGGVQNAVRGLLTLPALAELPVIIDADGLNALAQVRGWHESITCRAVLTPHPGELGRLLRKSVADVQADRIGVARACAANWRQTVVLKGAETVVAGEEGVKLSPFANAALATAGTGDVLAGTIAGLLAQDVDRFTGAALGVYLHGAAAELYADDYGSSGLLAGEVGAAIARAANRLRRGE